MGGVGALLATGLDQAAIPEAFEHLVEQKLLSLTGDQSGAELTEDREIESGIGQLQTERVLPVDAGADRVGGLPVAEVLKELHQGHRGQSGGQPRLAALG